MPDMSNLHRILAVVSLLSLAPWPAAGQAPVPSGADAAVAQPMPLTDAQVKGFLDATDELRKLGDAVESRLGADPSRPAAFAEAIRTNSNAMEILQRHGFDDPVQFSRVGWNSAMAYSVLEQGGPEALEKKMAASRAKQAQALAQMRQHMPPEQVAALEAQMTQGVAMAERLQDVPPGNVEVVARYRDRIAKLGEDR